MEIPDGHFVHRVDLDAEEPYCEIVPKDDVFADPITVLLPKALAYYLRTHWCGSQKMHDPIEGDSRREIRNGIKELLLWDVE